MAGTAAVQQWEQMRNESSDNRICVDCGANNPQWASVSFGVLFCLECSGVHRSLGVHISFVRSMTMDSWSDKQLSMLRAGGNQRFKEFMQAHGVSPRTAIKEKYSCKTASIYKEKVKAIAEGRPWDEPPAEAFVEDAPTPSAPPRHSYEPSPYYSSNGGPARQPMAGFGSVTNAPLPTRQTVDTDEYWNSASALLGDSWTKISTAASSAALVTSEYAKTAAEKLAESSKDISSKLQEQGILDNVAVLKEKVAETSTVGWGLLSSYWNSAKETVSQYAASPGEGEQQQQTIPSSQSLPRPVSSDRVMEDEIPRGIDDLLLKKDEGTSGRTNGHRSLIAFDEDDEPSKATTKTSGWGWEDEDTTKPSTTSSVSPSAISSTARQASPPVKKEISTLDDDWWSQPDSGKKAAPQKKKDGWDESWDEF